MDKTLDKKTVSEILALVVAILGIIAVVRAVYGRK